MPNVIRMRGKPTRAPATVIPTAVRAGVAVLETVDRIMLMHVTAKEKLQTTLSLLDMTLVNIRQLSGMIVDPNARAVLDRELVSLEDALKSARARALEL